jgi:Leucine-rich repeat (LRR) protein
VAYGEQRDLFSPAGLENIFRPPPAEASSPIKSPVRNFGDGSIVMPSSPPPYNLGGGNDTFDAQLLNEGIPEEEEERRQQPRMMKYNLVDEGSEFSANDLSRSSHFLPARAVSQAHEGSQISSDISSSFGSSVARKPDPMNAAGRTVSGQSDIRNEELSPIYIARHNTTDGNIDYAALDLPPAELEQRLEQIREDSPLETSENQNETSQILPEDVTVGTDDYAHNGRFVNLRRGGHSQEGSFQKRMLSPSSLPAVDESAMLPEESMQASTPKQLPNIKKTRASNEYQQPRATQVSPPAPHTPHTSPKKTSEKEQKSSSGSPLKLFGNYDTFTNQKLLRRLSQFEGDYEGKSGDDGTRPSTRRDSTYPEINEAFVASPEEASQRSSNHRSTSQKFNSFGEGELDNFQFSEEISYDSNVSNLQDEDKENMSLPPLAPSTQTRFKFQLDPSPALEEDAVTRYHTRHTNTASTTKQTISVRRIIRPGTSSSDSSVELPASQRIENLETPRKRNGDFEGKRLPKTPLKDPTPKRRRTLHETENPHANMDDESVDFDSLKETHLQMQSVIGRKRKDARYDDDQQAANPKVLAMRQILRPRTPTPSQRSSVQQERAPLQEVDLDPAERARLLQEKKIAKIQAELDSTNPLKASTVFGMSQQMQNDSRKGSVTTQDFLDEAKKIMAGIRGKARPRSGLTSLEESESENDRNKSAGSTSQDDELEDSYQESTKEPFSRPPSREGKPISRPPLKQEDPVLLDHLRKYQEMSDMDGVIASSIKSIAMAKEAANTAKEIDRITEETISKSAGRMLSQEYATESDPPNIRISENPDLYRKRKHSTSSVPTGSEGHIEAEFPSHGSNSSSSQSTSRSIPTGSSRGSDSRRVIAPHTVSHLIPEQLAGMVFDRERNKWVKRKSVSDGAGRNFLPSDETDDDPFGDIPDLSVDETQELQRLKAVAARKKEEARVAEEGSREEASEVKDMVSQQDERAMAKAAPERLNVEEPSSEPSRFTRFTSSGTVPGTNTRLTSWGDEHGPVSKLAGSPSATETVHHHRKAIQTVVEEYAVEEVEREISIHEDRVHPASPQRRRNVTISFSSPVASVIQPSEYENETGSEHEVDEASQSDNDVHDDFSNGSIIITKKSNSQRPDSSKPRSAFGNTSRRMSFSGHTFSARPVSRIDEQDEDSLSRNDDDQHRRSISVIIATPAPSRRSTSLARTTPRPTHEIGNLTLTPLSDFTMHQANESFGLEVSYIARISHHVPDNNSGKTLSNSIKTLVEKITEVEPYEPFWEHMKQAYLKNKRLTSLHKLDEFCQQLEELDVSHNQISQLNGVPRTVRHLRITHNYLSDLAAWNHLSNLQYIDVSNNEIESLSAFRSLVHLRGLRADNNKIVSLDGIGHLDGLLSLRLRGNLIESIDFTGTRLQRLTDLDVKNNRIWQAQNLHELRSLTSLNLENNSLPEFSMDGEEVPWSLKYLKLGGNNLESLDVSRYLNLRLLYLDRNCLGKVTGLLRTKHLDSLSMREQQDDANLDPSFISEAFEVRKLFISGNLLDTFKPTVDFLNLQYLELANCGLESLPAEFGQMIVNTRVLNLNFNALRDIRPLLGILRLKKLHLAGNRLTRLRTTTYVLSQFPSLSLADLRNNPLTLGFYPPLSETRLVVREGIEEEQDTTEPFTLGKADRGRDARYASRLDIETKMLRRVFEMLVLGGNLRLKSLDGLSVDRSVLEAKDKVWDALIETGVLTPHTGETCCEEHQEGDAGEKEQEPEQEPKTPEKSIFEERWHAEDSFA